MISVFISGNRQDEEGREGYSVVKGTQKARNLLTDYEKKLYVLALSEKSERN